MKGATGRLLVALCSVSACGGEPGARVAVSTRATPAQVPAMVATNPVPAGSSGPASAAAPMTSATTRSDTTDGSALRLCLHGGVAQLLLLDPAGRRLGTDGRTDASFGEIPDGSTSESTPGDEDAAQAIRELLVMRPISGTYTVRVTGERDGVYTLDAGVLTTALVTADGTVADMPIGRGEVHEYRFDLDGTSSTPRLTLTRVR